MCHYDLDKSENTVFVVQVATKQPICSTRQALISSAAASLWISSTPMNTFVNQFSTSSHVAQLKRAQKLIAAEDDECPDAAWGSQAGFGNMIKGIPTFTVPSVPDVRLSSQKYI